MDVEVLYSPTLIVQPIDASAIHFLKSKFKRPQVQYGLISIKKMNSRSNNKLDLKKI